MTQVKSRVKVKLVRSLDPQDMAVIVFQEREDGYYALQKETGEMVHVGNVNDPMFELKSDFKIALDIDQRW